ncbi:MAG: tyrosinase family protein [Xanthobacteraceae bacterium]
MRAEITIASADHDGRVYLTWTPVQASVRLLEGPGAGPAVAVTLRSGGSKGQVVFDLTRTHRGSSALQLSLPGDGSPVKFWVAGEFDKASSDFGDAKIDVVEDAAAVLLGSTPLMVRIRKDAQSLSAAERDRFLSAFSILNGQGTGRYKDFREMHMGEGLDQAHGDLGFLPWHRAYLLDLERELQAIDPQVTLPYWRFDQPAPSLFSLDFIGLPNSNGRVQFAPGHPFEQWTTDRVLGINRPMEFAQGSAPAELRSEEETMDLGNGRYLGFSDMEGDPHGAAHLSFEAMSGGTQDGYITSTEEAPRDPLFFLLHANVDRLWAKWQWFRKLFTESDPNCFPQNTAQRPGHNLNDTLWPWNGVTDATDDTRPPTAPGGSLAASVLTSAPGPSPTIRSVIDFQGVKGSAPLGFDYDDVPFEMQEPAIA